MNLMRLFRKVSHKPTFVLDMSYDPETHSIKLLLDPEKGIMMLPGDSLDIKVAYEDIDRAINAARSVS